MKQSEYIDTMDKVVSEIEKVIIGRKPEIEMILMALLADGHVLLEGVPGTAKTLMVESAAKALGGNFRKIQFVPDMLPSDIVGTYIYADGKFQIQHGPLMGKHFVLTDEINRSPAITQAALLQAMQEREVTVLGKETFPLEDPFMILATQNPIEQEGTYELPEAQIDRFMIKVPVNYTTREEEKQMVKNTRLDQRYKMGDIIQITDPGFIVDIREQCKKIPVSEKAIDYIVNIIRATRVRRGWDDRDKNLEVIKLGASPRAILNLRALARVRAFMMGKDHVYPEDIDHVKTNILRHRIHIEFRAMAKGWTANKVLEKISEKVKSA